MRTLGLAALFSVALAAGASEAHAAVSEAVPTVESEPEPPKRWYGWATALSDVGTAGIAAFALADERYQNLIFIAAAGYLIAPPAIHLTQRNVKSAQWSGIFRLAAGTVSLATGFVISARTGAANDSGSMTPTYITVATGLLVPVVVDAAFLSFAAIEDTSMTVGVVREGGYTLGLAGRF